MTKGHFSKYSSISAQLHCPPKPTLTDFFSEEDSWNGIKFYKAILLLSLSHCIKLEESACPSPEPCCLYYLLYICPLTWCLTSLMAGHTISRALPICLPAFLVSSWCCFSCSWWSFGTNSSPCIVRCFWSVSMNEKWLTKQKPAGISPKRTIAFSCPF